MNWVNFLVILLAAMAALGTLLFLFRDVNLLCEASVEHGHITHFRGRAPKQLVRDFNDVLRQRPVTTATIRIQSSAGIPELVVSGDVVDAESQRLRNVLGTFPIARIRAEPYRRW